MKSKSRFKETEIGMIPEDWDLNKVSYAAENIFSGGTPNTMEPKYWNGDLPWLSSGETVNKFIYTTERKITKQGVENSSTRLAKKFDVVVASAGQGYTRGQVAFCMIDTYINQSVVALRADKEKLNSLFLFYNLSSRYKELRDISDAHSSRGSLTTKLLASLNIPLPPFQEQKNIGNILFSLDSKIELNQQMNKTLEAIAQAIFKRWFVDFEFPNEKGKPYKSSGGQMVDSKPREIPKGWGVSHIGSELKTVLGGTPDRTKKEYWLSGTIPWINSGKVNEFRITEPTEYITQEALKNSATKLLPERTTVIAITGATLGQVSLLEIESCANQSVIGVLASKTVPSEYIYFWIKNIINEIVSWQTGGAQQHINKDNINNSSILIPDSIIIAKYLKIIKPLFDQIALNCFENLRLSQIRDSLLPRLMLGKIRVKV